MEARRLLTKFAMSQPKARILIVDDDPMLTEMYSFILTMGDEFEVHVENRAGGALKTALEFKPDLILLDRNMPELSGAEVAAELRLAGLLNVKIAFLTGVGGPHPGTFEGLPSFPKPKRGEELASIVRNLLGAPCRFASLVRK